jgi:hypothetical protein
MNWLESKNCALNFAAMLMQRLQEPRGFDCTRGQPPYMVHGHWSLRAHELNQRATVPLQIAIRPDWMLRPPRSYSSADFVRREADWHCFSDGWFCIALPDEWRDTLAKEAKADGDPRRLLDIAATWTLASTDSLISRHLYAARYGITKWPDEWEQWGHAQAGIDEYRNQMRKGTPTK